MAVVRLVQDEGLDRRDITVSTSEDENSAVSEPGADIKSGHPGIPNTEAPNCTVTLR